MSPSLPPELPAEMLARGASLPLKPAPVTLRGKHVELMPLVADRDASPLFAVSNGGPVTLGSRTAPAYDAESRIWRYMFDGPFDTVEDLRQRLQDQVDVPNALCLCAVDVESGRQIGVANFLNNSPGHLKIELGGIWYSPVVQRTAANTEATYLMLRHTFGLGYRRVEWKCHSENERSRRAALRLGFTFEGIQMAHMVVKNRNRDTAWFRMLDTEWPRTRARLEAMV